MFSDHQTFPFWYASYENGNTVPFPAGTERTITKDLHHVLL